jgi:hypothetical protein
VNIAARIEALSVEGGICITKPVFDQVKKKLTNLGYENIGEHKEITSGRVPETHEIVSWVKMANPFKHADDINHIIEGLVLVGLDDIRIYRD